MAKFAVALCILAVACGAQASTNVIVTAAKTMISELTGATETMTSYASTAEDSFNATVQAWLAEFESEYETLANKTEADVSSCTPSWSEIKEEASEVVANATQCVQEALNDWNSAANTTKAEMEEMLEELDTYLSEASACSSNLWNYLACLAQVTLKEATVTTNWTSLAASTVSMINDVASGSSVFSSCVSSADIATFQAALEEWYETAQTCIATLANEATTVASA